MYPTHPSAATCAAPPEPTQEVQDAIEARLSEHGWRIDQEWGPCIAYKDYATAVGDREAFVKLTRRSDGMALRGCYLSEGRNVLATIWALFNADASVSDVPHIVDQFVVEADKEVDDSYARRLFLRYGETDRRPGVTP